MQLSITKEIFLVYFKFSVLVLEVGAQADSVPTASPSTPPECCCPPIAIRRGICQTESDVAQE